MKWTWDYELRDLGCFPCKSTYAGHNTPVLVTRALAWAEERPKVPGWYWWRAREGAPESIVEIDMTQGFKDVEPYLGCWGAGGPLKKVSAMSGQWAGPIEKPNDR